MELTRTFKQIRAYAERRGLPMIPVAAASISMVKDPATFYKLLLSGMKGARSRVALSALYVGTGPKEQALMQMLHDNLKKNPQLDVSITLDMNRAKREDQEGNSSVSMIQDMLGQKSIRLNLMRANIAQSSSLQHLFSRFQKLNELYSTYHSKLTIFDEDVIITGANLSGIYFEARQDRYVKINNSPLLSNYICELLDRLQQPLNQSLGNLIDGYNNQFISDHLSKDVSSDCYIIPLCQFGCQNVRACDDFLLFLNDMLPNQAELHMSTGYFNPKIQIRLNSVIAPSEQANGFYQGSGLLKHVPRVYRALMSKYLNRNPNCELFLYERPGWSYHAKGLWVDGLPDLGMYMIGSSNFNWRSSERDFEVQFLLLTTNPKLKQCFKQDRDRLLNESIRYKPDEKWPLSTIYNIAATLLKSLL
jgi:CDP-diacylglycerol--glycerol-3-phosphate 3-phosphatidyltransferase